MDGARFQDETRPRRPRRPARPIEIAAAVGVIVAGVGLIAGIVLLDPRWERIFASWRELSVIGFQLQAIRPRALEVQPTPASFLQTSPRTPEPAPSQQIPMRPAPAPESTPLELLWPSPAESDATQVMANLLVSQLGPDSAWRTAMANAEAQAADGPEHAYWRAVAALIREGGFRPRP